MIQMFKVKMNPVVALELQKVLHSGYIGQGPKVDDFEHQLRAVTGAHPVTTTSGTDALTIAYRLAGIGPGTEVISTPMTCAATNIPLLHLGAKILWADVDRRTGLIYPESVSRLAKDHHPKAIVAVDWGGQPADYDALMGHDVPVISDAAHSIGSRYKDRKTGTVADITCFSFQAIKHLTTGDGGALTTLRADWWGRARRMRWFGYDRDDKRYEFRGEQDIEEPGYKAHMNDLAATIGIANLALLDEELQACRLNAVAYATHLDDKKFGRSGPDHEVLGSWWLYTTLLPGPVERESFRQHMLRNDVQVSQVHWRNDQLTCFAGASKHPLPGLEEFSRRMICLPTHSGVDAREVAAIANGWKP